MIRLIQKNLRNQEDFVGIRLGELIDDLVVIDSKDEERVIKFYVINDENGSDRDVLAMLKEIAIGTEVLLVAEGETLVHIEAHDNEDPVDPEEPENQRTS